MSIPISQLGDRFFKNSIVFSELFHYDDLLINYILIHKLTVLGFMAIVDKCLSFDLGIYQPLCSKSQDNPFWDLIAKISKNDCLWEGKQKAEKIYMETDCSTPSLNWCNKTVTTKHACLGLLLAKQKICYLSPLKNKTFFFFFKPSFVRNML